MFVAASDTRTLYVVPVGPGIANVFPVCPCMMLLQVKVEYH